jgi:dTDP-4-dehydrorhamnose reductase
LRVLITGGGGLLGGALVRAAPAGIDVHATVRTRPSAAPRWHPVDLNDAGAFRRLVETIRPDLVIHTAYDPTDLQRGIVEMSRLVAAATEGVGAALIHVSSDRVLSGESAPYDESAVREPIEPYGEAKARAEEVVMAIDPRVSIVRTSLIVGTDPPDRISANLIEALREGRGASLFVDELRCPIHADDLAAQIWEIAALPEPAGVWNLVGPEAVSRFALGVLVARRNRLDAGAIVPALNRTLEHHRPRDLRLTTARADAELRTRARPISEALLSTG